MKKIIIFKVSILILVFLSVIGVSYAMWNMSISQDKVNVVETKCFDLSISRQKNNITLKNAYPISNDKGKNLTPFTFTVTNTCDITAEYSVNLEVLKNSTLASKFIEVMFENNINLLNSYKTTDTVNSGSVESRQLTNGILKSGESKEYSLRLWLDYDTTLEDLNNEIKTFKAKIVIVGKPIDYDGDVVFDFDYTGSSREFMVPTNGTYKVELWGASGGGIKVDDTYYDGGGGGYVAGLITLEKNSKFYIQVGGSTSSYKGGYNGGALGGDGSDGKYTGGGGSTDVRLNDGSWNDFNSLKSRIMIAAGGAGTGYYCAQAVYGGAAGGLSGYSGNIVTCYSTEFDYNHIVATAGTQVSGGLGCQNCNNYNDGNGYFGYSTSTGHHYGTGGASGYYAGGSGSSTANNVSSGAGGSSFISGHNGCDAIKEESTEDNIIHTGQSKHYSGLYFTNTVMIDGAGYRWTNKKKEQIGMPSYNDNSIIMGNSGNGHARITLVSIAE